MQLRGQVLTNRGKVSAGLATSRGYQTSDLRATVSVVALQFLPGSIKIWLKAAA